ncbi:MAG: hypothetical protein MK193_03465 [Lentisphaeria bacterium]|nr:hypothetical protein [Lentisphaeria bacterium]
MKIRFNGFLNALLFSVIFYVILTIGLHSVVQANLAHDAHLKPWRPHARLGLTISSLSLFTFIYCALVWSFTRRKNAY